MEGVDWAVSLVAVGPRGKRGVVGKWRSEAILVGALDRCGIVDETGEGALVDRGASEGALREVVGGVDQHDAGLRELDDLIGRPQNGTDPLDTVSAEN